MISLNLPRLTGLVALTVLVIGCGPTAEAPRTTLPPRTLHPATSAGPTFATPSGSAQSLPPAPTGTPQPTGIAQAMTNFPQGDAYEVSGVATTPAGYLAVGFAGTGGGYFGLHQGVVWTSSDGLSWQQKIDPAFVDVLPTNVIALGSDVYIFGDYSTCAEALDEECADDPNAGNVIFKSTDGGATWAQLAQTQDILHASFDGLTTWNDKLVSWGSAADDSGTTTIWTSTDGLTWTPTTDLATIDPVDSVGAGGPGLVAFGAEYVEAIEDVKLVGATSTDGLKFTSATVPEITAASVISARSGPGGMAGVGWAASDVSPSLGLAVFSGDGTNWSEATASDGSFDNVLINDLHSTASEYVAVGSTIDADDMTLQTARAWASADGRSWRSIGDFGGLFSQYGASGLGPNGLVVFTADQQDSGDDENLDVTSTINGWFIPTDKLTP